MAFGGYSTDATYNYSSSQATGSTAVTVSLNYGIINNSVPQQVPIITPYGYISIPDDNAACVYEGIGNYQATHVVGYTNTQATDSNLAGLLKGETALFSKGNYTYQVKNDKLYVVFTNDADQVISTRVTNDENVNTILIDTIAEIKALELKLNNFWVSFNAHVHPGVTPGGGSTGIITTPEPPYTATANFIRDDTFLGSDGAKNFISDPGRNIV